MTEDAGPDRVMSAEEDLRIALKHYTVQTVPVLNIDDYAAVVYRANLAAGL